jgi:hypothetical protein
MGARRNDEVIESVKELARIYRPTNVRKFVREYVKKYKIHGGYEEQLANVVELELSKMT